MWHTRPLQTARFECLSYVLSFFRFSGGSLTVFRPTARIPRFVVFDVALSPSGKVGDVEAEPTGNIVVVLTPLFPQSRDRASRQVTEVKVSRLRQRPPELSWVYILIVATLCSSFVFDD
uniref:Uncharacterized protein n=1 Tax=Ananas comosus var. bracteatus TaxID=296719 RepID=A0A6V7QGV6_ANACO|nr:unnamed protein product [Ananas comosus var. bracteatus]